MYPDYPSPEDDPLAGPSTHVEQQLKMLQPLPVSFDAETIFSAAALRADRQAEPNVTLVDRNSRERPARLSGWLPVSMSFACGAVLGVAITFFVLLSNGTTTAARKTNWETSPSISLEHDARAPTDIAKGNPSQADISESQDFAQHSRNSQFSNWSRRDQFAAAQLLDIRAPGSSRKTPLMAGYYVLRSAPVVSGVEPLMVSEPNPSADSPSTGGREFEVVSPTRTTNRGQLLQELLGVRVGSAL